MVQVAHGVGPYSYGRIRYGELASWNTRWYGVYKVIKYYTKYFDTRRMYLCQEIDHSEAL